MVKPLLPLGFFPPSPPGFHSDRSCLQIQKAIPSSEDLPRWIVHFLSNFFLLGRFFVRRFFSPAPNVNLDAPDPATLSNRDLPSPVFPSVKVVGFQKSPPLPRHQSILIVFVFD